ncbi:integrase, catalytic region, zinc finger, CCHC-type containing protein [Tanacetum coccineum]|uniref:Integrase, catalytic region, zinc finger, CCHC-type containing protein n=1 Tax=Tanacetum coccineum TaxID=301880 RepID=A0ABQ5HMD4_9ASTR
MIIAGADNHPLMLKKSLYDSWKSRMDFYMENRENRRMILDSVQNGSLVWPTVVQEDGLPPDVYAIVNHHKFAKEIWDRVKLLMQGTKLSLQEKEYDMVTMQKVQGRQGQSYVGNSYKGNATSSGGNNARGQARVVKCYNFQGEGHMARQCTQSKRPRNATWFKEKAMLAEAQEDGQILDEEQLAFLTDPGIPDGQATQTTIPNNAAF